MAPRAGTRGGRGGLRTRARTADEGAAAAEFAMVMPALLLIIGIVVGAGAVGATQLRAMDAARAAAREIARGEVSSEVIEEARKTAGPEARVTIADDDAYAEVTVEIPLPDAVAPVLESVTATATARREG